MEGEYKSVNKYKTKKMTTKSIRRPQNLFHNKLITVFYYQGYQLKLISFMYNIQKKPCWTLFATL